MDASTGCHEAATAIARLGLSFLVVFNVIAKALAILLILMGREGAREAPLAGGAVVALFLLMFFYARWMFPGLKTRHLLAVILLKELGVSILLGLAVGAAFLLRQVVG